MKLVFLTALGVGGATILGSIIGFLFKNITHKFSDLVLSFAAGVMLAAAILGLVLPSVEYGNLVITIAGIFTGALCLNLIDRLVPHMHNMLGVDSEAHHGNANLDKVLLFVSAIAIHNLPEGIAAGVSFGSGNDAEALMIAGGIALQNIPEGMVIIGPVEVVGTLLGYYAVTVATAILPFALAFAGGTMLYVISDEMIPETHHDNESGATYALLVGFCVMLISDVLLG